MFTALIICLRMWFRYFIISNNLSNNKLLDQDPQRVCEASLEIQGSQ
jgi:low temperature requirement protein LtrA